MEGESHFVGHALCILSVSCRTASLLVIKSIDNGQVLGAWILCGSGCAGDGPRATTNQEATPSRQNFVPRHVFRKAKPRGQRQAFAHFSLQQPFLVTRSLHGADFCLSSSLSRRASAQSCAQGLMHQLDC